MARHSSVEQIDICEIDKMVVDVSNNFRGLSVILLFCGQLDMIDTRGAHMLMMINVRNLF